MKRRKPGDRTGTRRKGSKASASAYRQYATVGDLMMARGLGYQKSSYNPSQKNLGFHDVLVNTINSGPTETYIPTAGQVNGQGTNPPTASGLLAIPRGNGATKRNEDMVMLKKIQMHLQLHKIEEQDEGEMNAMVKVAIVWDKRANGALPAVTDVFEDATVDSFNDLYNRKRFTVLFRKNFVFNQPSSGTATDATSAAQLKYIEKNIDCNIPIQYKSSDTGVVADVVQNNIFLVWITNRASMITGRARFRFRFYDIE